MRCTDLGRVAKAVAGWGALGVLITRAANFVDQVKRFELRCRTDEFVMRHGARGAAVLAAYNDANPFGVALGMDTRDAYVNYAEQFMELWESPAHKWVGGHGRVYLLVYKSFAPFGHDERAYLPYVSRIADKIWWQREFSGLKEV